MPAEVVPGHGRELGGIVTGELGNRQWRAHSGELGAGEDLNGRPELLERRKDTGRASKRVVERRVNLPVAGDGAHLAQQELGTQAEAVVPGRRDGVIAEDDRPASAGLHRPQISQPIKIPNTTAAANMTTVPKISGT